MRDSPLGGRGAFALVDIPAGTTVSTTRSRDGIVFNGGDDGYSPEFVEAMWQAGEFSPCTPPSNVIPALFDGERFIAARDIKAGEELLVHCNFGPYGELFEFLAGESGR